MFSSAAVRVNLVVFGLTSVTAIISGGVSVLLILVVNSGSLFLSESAFVYQHKNLLLSGFWGVFGSLVFTCLSPIFTWLSRLFTGLFMLFTSCWSVFTVLSVVCTDPAANLRFTLYTQVFTGVFTSMAFSPVSSLRCTPVGNLPIVGHCSLPVRVASPFLTAGPPLSLFLHVFVAPCGHRTVLPEEMGEVGFSFSISWWSTLMGGQPPCTLSPPSPVAVSSVLQPSSFVIQTFGFSSGHVRHWCPGRSSPSGFSGCSWSFWRSQVGVCLFMA